MKLVSLLFLLFSIPAFVFAQSERKGTYGSIGAGYGSYHLDVSGNNYRYAEQRISQMVIWLGIEQKSVFQKNNFVFDWEANLTGGFGVNNKSKIQGPYNSETSGGYSLGVRGLAKAGIQLGNSENAITPLIGIGPNYIFLQSGSGDDGVANQIYGMQGYAGVDFKIKKFTITPQVHFGIATWGSSDAINNATQEGQPSIFETGIKFGIKF